MCATDDAGLRAKAQDFVELFSEPRCVPEARKQGLSAEASFDLSTGWDCRKMTHRKQAWAYLKKHRPKVVGMSPPCTMLSRLQNLNPRFMNSYEGQKKMREAIIDLRFCAQVAHWQLDRRG